MRFTGVSVKSERANQLHIAASDASTAYTTRIACLIERLAQQVVSDDTCNQYADDGSRSPSVRRDNLTLYLQRVHLAKPDLILVGEAPGYLGCRRTGVPFTSDCLLLADGDPLGLFGAAYGFQLASDDGRVSNEQTATIVWRELRRHNARALGWNAWPFHPHRFGLPQSNRTPRIAELRAGLDLLHAALSLAPGIPVVAMGNSAARSLQELGIEHTKVRHPAQGGANQFSAGLAQIIERMVRRSTQAGTIAATKAFNTNDS